MASLKPAAACVCAALLLAACGTSAGRGERRAAAAPPVGAVEAGDLRFDALAPQPLDPGACGMYLWAQSAGDPVFVLAALTAPPRARVRVNGRDRDLARTAAEGQAAHGHFEQQTFSDGRLTLTVDVTFDLQRRMSGGAPIERGVIRVTDREGWETLIPVGGLVACES